MRSAISSTPLPGSGRRCEAGRRRPSSRSRPLWPWISGQGATCTRCLAQLHGRAEQHTLASAGGHGQPRGPHWPHEGGRLSRSHLCVAARRQGAVTCFWQPSTDLCPPGRTYVLQAGGVQDAECIGRHVRQELVAAHSAHAEQLQRGAVACSAASVSTWRSGQAPACPPDTGRPAGICEPTRQDDGQGIVVPWIGVQPARSCLVVHHAHGVCAREREREREKGGLCFASPREAPDWLAAGLTGSSACGAGAGQRPAGRPRRGVA